MWVGERVGGGEWVGVGVGGWGGVWVGVCGTGRVGVRGSLALGGEVGRDSQGRRAGLRADAVLDVVTAE